MGNHITIDFCQVSRNLVLFKIKNVIVQHSNRTVNGNPLGSQGSPPMGFSPMGSLGLPRVPLPWDPLGSQGFPSHGSPAMGSLWAPKGPLPWDPTPSNPIPIRTPPSDWKEYCQNSTFHDFLIFWEVTPSTNTFKVVLDFFKKLTDFH